MNNNPLLLDFDTIHQTPPFELIQEEHYTAAFKESIKEAEDVISELVSNKEVASFENTILTMEYADENLEKIASVFFNLDAANTNDKLQAIALEVSPMLTHHANNILLNEELFIRVKKVYDTRQEIKYTTEQLKLIEDSYKSFVREGALLSGAEKERYREISTELSKQNLTFGQNVLAETNDYELHITEESQLSGLPNAIIEAAVNEAKSRDKKGWVFTLQAPSYVPFMKFSDKRELREKLYRAYASRAYRGNKNDNSAVIKKIVNLRLEKAKLLGYTNYAEYVLENRMAQTPQKVNSFLQDLLDKSLPFAKEELKEVETYASVHGLECKMQKWDLSYYSEKLKNEKFSITDEMTKPYFQLEKVQIGIFDLANTLYGLTFKENSQIPAYNKGVKAYEVFDENNIFLAVLYLDFFPSKGKSGGAWMTTYREQYIKANKDIRPFVSLVTNFSRPTSDTPSLLTYQEVRTFLHEFGHGLHGMLSKVTYKSQSGTNVFRDFVELPSQIFENWGIEKEWLNSVGKHYKTGETIPDDLVDKIIASANFQSGIQSVRQISFGINDMAWHSLTQPFEDDINTFEEESMSETELLSGVEGTCFSTAFSHIFAGGYAAGYYGYKWAEVLDADAFSVFKKNGIFDKDTANSFKKNILEKGSTQHPMELYKAFRGQEPDNDALLRREGLIKL